MQSAHMPGVYFLVIPCFYRINVETERLLSLVSSELWKAASLLSSYTKGASEANSHLPRVSVGGTRGIANVGAWESVAT